MTFHPVNFSNQVSGSSFVTDQLNDFGRFGGFRDGRGSPGAPLSVPGQGIATGRDAFSPPVVPGGSPLLGSAGGDQPLGETSFAVPTSLRPTDPIFL